MKEKIIFFEDFLEAEFKYNSSMLDIQISNEQVIENGYRVKAYFHEIMPDEFGGRFGFEFETEEDRLLSKNKLKKVIKRQIFKISQFNNSSFGENLHEVLIEDDIYGIDVSFDLKTQKSIFYSRKYFIGKTRTGIKIIDKWFFSTKNRSWNLQHEYKPDLIKKLGEPNKVIKIQPPKEDNSLKEYIKD